MLIFNKINLKIMCLISFSWVKSDSAEKIKSFRKNNSVKWVELDITNICNLNCKYCYLPERGQKTIKDEIFYKIINVLKKSRIKQITFGGGEPLLHPEVVGYVKYCVDHGFVTHILSNGFYLDESLAKKLSKAGLSQIQMNIDSINPEKHDKLRGKTGSFDKAIKAFELCKKYNILACSQTVVTKDNYKDIPLIFDMARKIGAKKTRIWDMVCVGSGSKNTNIKASSVEFKQAFNSALQYAILNNVKQIISYEPSIEFNNVPEDVSVLKIGCPPKEGMFFSVDINGNAYFCSPRRDLPMFNVLEYDSLENVVKDSLKKNFKKICLNNSYCQKYHKKICKANINRGSKHAIASAKKS